MVIFDKIDLGYSHKNIPVPTKDCFLKSLIEKTESFIKRIRWKVFHFENLSENDKPEEKYGFKSSKTPPQNPALNEFENDVYDLISNVEFRAVDDEFQKKMKADISEIRNSNMVILPADKQLTCTKCQ